MAGRERPTANGPHGSDLVGPQTPPSTIHSDGDEPTQSHLSGPHPGGAGEPSAPLPAAFGRYRVLRVLGRGGMGSVYFGHDEQLDRSVAIKVPHRDLFRSPEGRELFLQEAKTLARLDHAGIIPVYDAGETEDGLCYVVFRYVDGETLSDRLRKVRVPFGKAADWLADVAESLHHAHKNGFVHRDIKPTNILIDRTDKIWVADFGLAVTESMQRHLAGQVSGTPAYMAPEQARGDVQHLDGRADIWSVGVMMYELLTGRRPFHGDNALELFEEIAAKDPRPPRMIDETIPEELERITLKCLNKQVAERYLTAHDLARELRAWNRRRAGPHVKWIVALTALTALAAGAFAWQAARSTPAVDNPRPVQSEPAGGDNGDEQELALLIAEMRGLRRDLGDSLAPRPPDRQRRSTETSDPDPPRGAAAKAEGGGGPPASADNSPLASTGPIPLPGEFSELDAQLRAARSAGDEDEEERLLLKATNELLEAGHFAIAEHLAKRMVVLAGNDPGDVPFAYGQLGMAQSRLGRFPEALDSYQRACDVYQKLYDRMLAFPDSEQILKFRSHLARLLGITLMRMGNVHKAADDYGLARAAYEESLRVFEAQNREGELATLLLNYGGLESQHGNTEPSIRLLQQGLEIVRKQGNTEEEAEFLVNLGNALSRKGELEEALGSYERAHQCLTPKSNYALRAALLGNWCTSLLEAGQHDRALEILQELQKIARPHDEDAQRVLEFLPALNKVRHAPETE